jgi:hypothetical protein
VIERVNDLEINLSVGIGDNNAGIVDIERRRRGVIELGDVLDAHTRSGETHALLVQRINATFVHSDVLWQKVCARHNGLFRQRAHVLRADVAQVLKVVVAVVWQAEFCQFIFTTIVLCIIIVVVVVVVVRLLLVCTHARHVGGLQSESHCAFFVDERSFASALHKRHDKKTQAKGKRVFFCGESRRKATIFLGKEFTICIK